MGITVAGETYIVGKSAGSLVNILSETREKMLFKRRVNERDAQMQHRVLASLAENGLTVASAANIANGLTWDGKPLHDGLGSTSNSTPKASPASMRPERKSGESGRRRRL